MNLQTVRQQFIKLSGRYDLATTTTTSFDTDAGADFFINAGMRFLDKRFQTAKTDESLFEEVAAGVWYLTFQNCSVIKEVWCNDTEERWQLKRVSYETLKTDYNGLVSASTGDAPYVYSPVWLRTTEATDFQSLGAFFNYVKTTDDGTYNGIVFAPKTDKAYNLEVMGSFNNIDLSGNTASNYWTVDSPEILLKAALYQLTVFYGATQEAAKWLELIEIEGSMLEKNFIDQETYGPRVMAG